jgi:hypothetical protein
MGEHDAGARHLIFTATASTSLAVALDFALFAWLISHQPTVLFSQNKPATSNQPEPASSTLLSEQTSTSHQPPANRTGCWFVDVHRVGRQLSRNTQV